MTTKIHFLGCCNGVMMLLSFSNSQIMQDPHIYPRKPIIHGGLLCFKPNQGFPLIIILVAVRDVPKPFHLAQLIPL